MKSISLCILFIICISPFSFSNEGKESSNVFIMLDQLKRYCGDSARTNATDIVELNESITRVLSDNNGLKEILSDEICTVAKYKTYDISILLYLDNLINLYARTCESIEFLGFSKKIICSSVYSAESREMLLRKLGYEFRNNNIFRDGKYKLSDMANLLRESALCGERSIEDASIRMLVGWSINDQKIAPVSLEDGIIILKKKICEADEFVVRQPYMDLLAKVGYGRNEYLVELRTQVNDENVPLWRRYEYAKKMVEWDNIIVAELQSGLNKPLKEETCKSIIK